MRIMQTIVIVLTLGAPAVASAQSNLPEKYDSPMRAQCEAELDKDKTWQAELRAKVRPEVHNEDATQMLNNKKHVVAAYAVIWGLTVIFVVFMWLRQKRLAADILALEKELKEAVGKGA